MLIKSVELENIKSYAFAKIALGPGVTAILGENGAGKSTILEAVGFALFDHRNGKLSDLLREGAKTGRVTVSLTSSQDGAEYLVEREFTAKTTTSYRVHDYGGAHQVVAAGVADVQRWLKTHMGVPPDAHLATLFANTIGVAQQTFTAPFLLAPAQRKTVFDPLLRVEEYKKASDNLRPTVGQLKDDKVTLDTEIARIQGILTVLPGLREEDKDLGYDLARLGTVLALRKQQLSAAEAKLKGLGEAAKVVGEATQRADQARVRLDAHDTILDSATAAVDESQQCARIATQNLPGHQAYMEVQERRQRLNASRMVRDGLLREQRDAQTALAELMAATERVPEFQQRVDLTTERMTEIRTEIRKATELHQRLGDMRCDLSERREAMAALQSRQGAIRAEQQALSQQCDFLADPNRAACPTCGAELNAQDREALLKRKSGLLENLAPRATRVSRQIQHQFDSISLLQQRQGETQDDLRKLASAKDLVRSQQNVKARQDEMETLREKIAGLTGDEELVARLTRQLSAYADLEVQLSHVQEQEREHEQAHTFYLSYTALAKKLPDRQAMLDKLLTKQQVLKTECERLAKEYQQAQAAYDSEEHTKVQAETTRLQQELAGVTAQLKEKRYRLTVVQESIERLEATEKELAVKTAVATETSELLATIETVRDILREAGPYVTRRLVRRISQAAAAIFGDLTGDPGRRLQWTEDYQVLVEERGYNRTFAKHSGGERMLIAVAIRLAMLREISAIDVAFFDEPTDSLSRTSCENLAEAMSQVKGFSQLFVISHDSTFESAAENTIRIVNDEKGSHVSTE